MKLTLLLSCILLVAYGNERDREGRKQINNTYKQDPKTYLCFAQQGWKGMQGYSMTNVPCTPEVLKEIVK